MGSTAPPSKGIKTDTLLGTVVNGKYRIEHLVAAGGMGKIYRAEQIALARPVALKVLLTKGDREGQDDPYFEKRFFREASILARLQHPNIVTVFDYGAIEGADPERYFISMEYLSGETLAARIASEGFLAVKDTVRIARQIARGLTEAHAHGVIHRDLKPSNVMLLQGRDGEDLAKIVDFGIVKIIGDASQDREDLTQEGSFIGSPKYMAPEQINRGGKVDIRTDIYSFGIILYQCLTGSVPFEAESAIQTLMAHLNQAPQPMRERNPASLVPEWLDNLVVGCIEKDPLKRPQTMDAVAKTLADAEAALNSGRVVVVTGTQSGSGVRNAKNLAASASGAGSGSGITTQGTISSLNTTASESERTRTSVQAPKMKPEARRSPFIFVLAAAAAILGVAAFVDLRRPAPAPPPAKTEAAPAAPSHFTLTVVSSPSEAEVRDGDRVLGKTPFELALDEDAVRRAPRVLTLAKDGFVPYPVVQGPSDKDVRVIAQLAPAGAPAPPASTDPARSSGPAPTPHRSAHPPAAAPSASSTHPDLDIRMNR